MNPGHYHEVFATNSQPHLLKKQFTPTQEQLEFAKQSLIEKHKLNNGIPQLLFCRPNASGEEDLLTAGQKTMIESGKKKYIDFVRKNYNQKITEELTSLSKLRSKIKENQSKCEEERQQKMDQKKGKNIMEQEVAKKRRAEDKKVTSGKKKVKADENPEKPAKGKKTAKKEEIQIRPPEPQPQQNEEQGAGEAEEMVSQSLGIDLLNSLSEDKFDNYEDEQQ